MVSNEVEVEAEESDELVEWGFEGMGDGLDDGVGGGWLGGGGAGCEVLVELE